MMRILYPFLITLFLFCFKTSFGQADNCSFATTIAVTANCSSPTNGTTIGATQNIAGCVGNADDDVWYQFVATATSHQIVVVPSASMDAVVQLFSGVCSSLITMSCMDAALTGQTETINATGLTIGNTYKIRVYHYGIGSGSGTFTICVTNPPPPPSNDNCASAINLTVNTTCINTAATTVGATQSLAGCSGTADDDVWFSFTAQNTTATVTVNPSSSMDAVAELFSGTCGSLTSIQCEDVGLTNGNEVINAVGLIPGNTYYVRVYDYYSGGGFPFDICITGPGPSAIPTNDEPCNAIVLPVVTSDCNYLQFSTIGATASLGAPTPASCVGGSGLQQGGFTASSHDVWFSVVAPANGQITITMQPNFGVNDGVLALYSGTCSSLTQVACSDDHNYPGTSNDLQPYISQTGLTPGATYFIRYWGYGTNAGDFGFCVSSPINDFCSTALFICDLNGYSASTSAAYTPDRPCNMRGDAEQNNPPTYTYTPGTNTGGVFGQAGSWGTGSPAFDVQINNNSWIKFTASNTIAILNVAIGNCWIGNYPSGGIQMQIFSATNCCNFTPVSNFEEGSSSFTITANNLTIGNDYYLMIDGFAGDICNYTITANAGVQFPDIVAPRPSICYGDTTMLYGPALASSYLWSPGGDTTQNITVAPSTTTTYTLVAAGVCGKKQTLTKTITVNPLPTILINSGNPVSVCNGSAVNLTASGAVSYVWSNSSTSNPISVSPTTPTSYAVTGTDANGCVGVDSVTVQINSLPTPLINTANNSICNGGTTTLHASGGGTYLWNNGTTLDSLVVNPTTTTTYSVTVDVGGCKDSTTQTVVVNPLPTINITGNNPVCVGNADTLTAFGGVAYAWSTGSTINTTVVSPTSNTTYTVTVTDTNNCVDSSSINVIVNSNPVATITGNSIICLGTSTSLMAGGGTLYNWNNGASTALINVSPQTDTTYAVIVNDANGCADSTSILIQVLANPSALITGVNTICLGESTTLTATGGGTYLWNTTDTNSAITIAPTTNTPYSVIVNVGGCLDTATQNIIVNPLPVVSITGIDTICEGTSTTLTASSGGTYTWNTGSIFDSIVVSPTSNSLYTVTVSNAYNCIDSANISVIVNPLPTINIAGNTTICEGVATTLTVSGANAYVWNTLAITSTINVSPTLTTNYSVVGTDLNGCIDSTQITITVLPLPIPVISGDSSICLGASTTLTATGGSTYLWSTTDTTSSITITPNDTTTYTVIIGANGCVDSTTYNVDVIPLPLIDAFNDTTIILGQSATIYAQGTAPFNWYPTDGLNCSTCASTIATPKETTTYCVSVTKNSCVNSSCVTVFVDNICGDLFVPNAFSPNGDGNNDCLKVYNNCLKSVLFRIYSRWGELLYESDSIDGCWDGTHNGKALNTGVYAFTVKATLINGNEVELKGNTTLFK